ncbi:MAG TPA: antibiotic biosynthesis monooxygenase [Anaerolineae bacterium]|nr:antibiotic biosynthesis monooxygenase [Anaerolineae bacterium]
MITVANRIPVNPAYAEAVEARFAQRASLVDQMDGFVSFTLLRPTKPEDPYVVITMWESKAHFEAWVKSPEFRAQHDNKTLPPEAFAGANKIEIHEVVGS